MELRPDCYRLVMTSNSDEEVAEILKAEFAGMSAQFLDLAKSLPDAATRKMMFFRAANHLQYLSATVGKL